MSRHSSDDCDVQYAQGVASKIITLMLNLFSTVDISCFKNNAHVWCRSLTVV